MSAELPDPLVPPEVDLRGYEFMPLYGDRLFGSETWISGSPEAKIAALRLWWRAYAKEVPSGSLPDNDVLLAEYSGCGSMVKAWQKLRPQALRGWIRCSDGRLYHKIVCEFAMSAWGERLKARVKGKAGAAKRWNKTDSTGNATANATAIKLDSTSNGTGNARAIARERIGEERIGQSSGTAPPPAAAEGCASKAVQVAVWLKSQGLIGANAANPKIIAIAEEGVTEQQIIEAVRVARTERGKGDGPFHFAYVLGILTDIRHPPERKTAEAWWTDDAKMMAKAREFGVSSHGKQREQLRQDINDAIAKQRNAVPRGTEAAA